MTEREDNPFEPPGPTAALPVGLRVEGVQALAVTSVTFRYSHDDLTRASSGRGQGRAGGAIMVLAPVAVATAVLSALFKGGGWSEVPGAMIATAVAAAVLGSAFMLGRGWGRSPSDAPFDTTFTLTPEGLEIREPGITEIRRSWPSIAAVE